MHVHVVDADRKRLQGSSGIETSGHLPVGSAVKVKVFQLLCFRTLRAVRFKLCIDVVVYSLCFRLQLMYIWHCPNS